MNNPADRNGKSYYKSNGEIQSLVQRFESCALVPSEMTHAAHLAVSAWYLSHLSMPEGTERIRENLIRFIERYRLKGYNETITLFWVKLVARFLEDVETNRPAYDMVNNLIERFGHSQIIFDYYSKEHLLSKEAQAGWAEPDLKPLDF